MVERVSLVITSKDRLQPLKKFVETIRKHTPYVEMVVVDDNSQDGTREWLIDQEDIVSIINYKSVPVDEANNQGAKKATGRYLWFVNEDMELLDDPIPIMIDMLRETNAGSIAQKVLLPNGNIQSRGHAFSGVYQIHVPGRDIRKRVDWCPFPFMRKDVLNKVGGWSVHGQIYYGDTDLGLTLQKAGYENWYCPEVRIVHNTLGLDGGGLEEVEKRKHNESVHQQVSRKSFMEKWEDWLRNEHDDLF